MSSFDEIREENKASDEATRAQTRMIWKGLLIGGGVLALMCCGFATLVVLRVT